ncbi:MAG: DoxX family protein [Anaerolineae bacterium]
MISRNWAQRFDRLDQRITSWMAAHGILLLRVSVGIVFLWFGVLKFIPGLSPADALATKTITVLTFGIVPPDISRPVLVLWETIIGIGLITGLYMRVTLLLLFVQMLGTVTPLVLFPAETWSRFPIVPTLEGQYILKNMVLVTAGIVIGATVRGGGLIPSDAALMKDHSLHQIEVEQH